ncbi:hypothetical protein [Yinghuangia soli]|uniref:Uncharacterized protein n=1 Tax=Yinghuangia soli TaxID=2908204 RepID=A0AA41QC38_9ACTN|nr:hypothetical protein [Yinghuangia soli]MCF2534057.1 hypothetical protein [Yinghuangia soli]
MSADVEAASKYSLVVARLCLILSAVLYVAGIFLPQFRYEYARDTLNQGALGGAIFIELLAGFFALVAFLIQRERKGLVNPGLFMMAVVASSHFTLRAVQA